MGADGPGRSRGGGLPAEVVMAETAIPRAKPPTPKGRSPSSPTTGHERSNIRSTSIVLQEGGLGRIEGQEIHQISAADSDYIRPDAEMVTGSSKSNCSLISARRRSWHRNRGLIEQKQTEKDAINRTNHLQRASFVPDWRFEWLFASKSLICFTASECLDCIGNAPMQTDSANWRPRVCGRPPTTRPRAGRWGPQGLRRE